MRIRVPARLSLPVVRDPVEYVVADGLGAADFAGALAPDFDLRVGSAATSKRGFYDTFDGRLHRAGFCLTCEDSRLTLRDAEGREAVADTPSAARQFLVADLPAGALRDRLAPVIGARALTRTVQVWCSTQLMRVLNEDAKTVVRLILEQPRLAAADGAVLRRRLRLMATRGYDRELRRVSAALADWLWLPEADLSLQDEAVVRAGGIPGGVSSRLDVPMDPAERADVAAALIAGRLVELIKANLPGTIADTDVEFLHDLRVSVRRTRSLQRELHAVFPAEQLVHFRAEFRWLQEVTGPSRDLDVYLHEFDEFRELLAQRRRDDLEPLRTLLSTQRARERRRMVRALRSPRTAMLLEDWRALLAGLGRPGPPTAPDAAVPIVTVAAARIGKVFRQIVKAGSAIDDRSPHKALHGLRKRCKELRYLLEFFGTLYPAEVTKPMVRTLKDLQDTLGRFQDREVQAELIHSLGEEVGALDDGTAALMAMGQLVERVEDQQDEARAEFEERFSAFAAKKQRKIVREVFG